MSGTWSTQLEQRFALQLPADLRAWLDEEQWQLPGGAEFCRPLKPPQLMEPEPGLIWAGFMLPDTLPLIAGLSARQGYRLYLLGAAPGVAERAAAVLAGEHRGLRIAGCYAGSPDPDQDDDLVARVTAARPDLLFVAYGAPRQDLWIHRNMARLGVPVCMGVGGTFDYIAGVTPRAPAWMRRVGSPFSLRASVSPSFFR